ncbi:DUF6414 family protein [Oceanospirillum maris]|uniref:DUF6414 family protein n=1 Tax=Oceanospirillum maris TaxID=64977 RepID=UPI00040AA595|nr:hypothetical protein [Oceanospirillum maris]
MIKSFIYLDNDKMFSLSSQIFEGVTEYVLNEESIGRDDSGTNTKKELGGSSKVIADVMRESKVSSEKKYLHDYSMTLFEKEMHESGKVLTIDSETDMEEASEILSDYSFVKIKSKAKFIDFAELYELMKNYRNLAVDIANASHRELIAEKKIEFEKLKNKPKKNSDDKKLISRIEKQGVAAIVHESLHGERLSEDFLNGLSGMIEFGFDKQLMLTQEISGVKFSTVLNRDCLRETYKSVLSKYARKTGKDVVVFGMVSQGLGESQKIKKLDKPDLSNLRAAVDNFSEHMFNIDCSISGKAESEVVIDPIAIYFEL